MRQIFPNLPLKNRRVAILIAVFALVGVVVLIKSLALTPTALITLTGKMEVIHYDDFADDGKPVFSSLQFNLVQGTKRIPLGIPQNLRNFDDGDTVEVKVAKISPTKAVPVSSLKVTDKAAPTNPEAAQAAGATASDPETKPTALMLLNFTNDPTFRHESAESALATMTTVNDFFKENSYGEFKFTGVTNLSQPVDVFGYYSVNRGNLTTCNSGDWATQAIAAAQAAGVDTAVYEHIMLVLPATPEVVDASDTDNLACIRGGAAGNGKSWYFGSLRDKTAIHELGHGIGFSHSNFWKCPSGSSFASWSSECNMLTHPSSGGSTADKVNIEYGGVWTPMSGCGTYCHFNNWEKAYLGWIDESKIQTVTSTSQVTLSIPINNSGKTVVRIPRRISEDGNLEYLYLEYRQPGGLYEKRFYGYPDGVIVRTAYNHNYAHRQLNDRNDVSSQVANSQKMHFSYNWLIDTTPDGASYNAPILAGNTFTDPLQGIKITTLSVSPTAATVRIEIPPMAKPDAPTELKANILTEPVTGTTHTTAAGGVTLEWKAATSQWGVKGYNVYRNGELIGSTPFTHYIDRDTRLAAATKYTYSLKAFDFSGVNFSDQVSFAPIDNAAGFVRDTIGAFSGSVSLPGSITRETGCGNLKVTLSWITADDPGQVSLKVQNYDRTFARTSGWSLNEVKTGTTSPISITLPTIPGNQALSRQYAYYISPVFTKGSGTYTISETYSTFMANCPF